MDDHSFQFTRIDTPVLVAVKRLKRREPQLSRLPFYEHCVSMVSAYLRHEAQTLTVLGMHSFGYDVYPLSRSYSTIILIIVCGGIGLVHAGPATSGLH